MTLALIVIAALVLVVVLLALGLCGAATKGDHQVDDALAMLRAEVESIYRIADRGANGDTDLAIQLAAQEFRARAFDVLDIDLMLSVHYDKGIDEVRWLASGNLDGIRGGEGS